MFITHTPKQIRELQLTEKWPWLLTILPPQLYNITVAITGVAFGTAPIQVVTLVLTAELWFKPKLTDW